jgi:hypothetical protein
MNFIDMQNKGFAVCRPSKHTAKLVYVVCHSGKLTAKSGIPNFKYLCGDIYRQILNLRGNICRHRGKLKIQKFTVRDWTAHGKWRPLGRAVRRAAKVGPEQ